MKRHCFTSYPLFALIGLILSPLAVAHASPSTADSVHFCLPFDYERWQRDRPLPAGKRLANLDVGQPRTVRMIYFLPNDRPYRQGVVDEMKAMMRRVQTFFADQMQAHGYGNTTFRFETDAQGAPLVHRVDGQHPDRHYNDNTTTKKVLDEIYFGGGPLQFDVLANDYLIVIDNSTGTIDEYGYKAGGVNTDFGKRGGITLVPSELYFSTVAHELGHTFGLWHDFRDDAYIMSYGGNSDRHRLSACAAEFLSVHPYFNADISLGGGTSLDEVYFGLGIVGEPSTIEMISPPYYPAGSTTISVRFKVSDVEGLHQVLLLDTKRESDGDAAGLEGLAACRGLDGEQDAVVEFEYDVSIPPYRRDPSDPEAHTLFVQVVDADGEVTDRGYNIAEASSYHIATLDHQNYIRSVSFSPDGTLLAIGGSDIIGGSGENVVSLWDVASRQQVATLQLEDRSTALSFSPDGTLLAIGGAEENAVSLWDVASRQQVATLQADWVRSVSFSPDGTLLAIAEAAGEDRMEVTLWDVASRQKVDTLQPRGGYVSSVSFSPDGTLLAIAESTGEEVHEVTLWDVASRQKVDTLQPRGSVWSLSFSPDGTLLATAGGLNQLWDVASRQEVTLELGRYSNSLSFSPDGTLLAIGSHGPIRLWDVASRQLVATFVHPGDVSDISFSPDGTLATGGSDGTVSLWDVSEWTGEQATTTIAHTLTKVSGEGQEGTVGKPLAKPFVVSVLNQEGAAFAGAVVRFSVTAGGGTLSPTTATTDANGRARSTLTLGSDPGTNTVAATVGGLQPVTFTAIGQATTDSDGEIADDESSGEDQPESEETPTTAIELEGISTSHDSVRENDEQATVITLTVTLDKAAATDETITLAIVTPTQGKTAKRNEDFDATLDSTLTIAKGQRTGTAQLTLTPQDNTTADGDKAFAVQATSSSGHAALINIKIIDNDSASEPQAWLTPDPSEVEFYADDPAWKTFTVHTNLDSVLVRANPPGSDPAIEVAGGQQVPTTAYCPAEGNDRPTRGRRDGWSLHVKACQAGRTKILLIDYDTGAVVQQYEVNVEASTSASATTALNPSYPNPFNSETVLSYTLPTASAIRLEVFTLSGQRVAVLHEGFQAAGYHTIAMDASDLASGVYLYRLTTPEGRFVQKFTLLR